MTSTTRLVYLGPPGTFSEAALLTLPIADGAELDPLPNVAAALDAVRQGDADGALVPFENSVEGSVSTTLDELAAGDLLQVTAEVVLLIRFALLARPDTGIDAVRTVSSHPHAQPQCRRWLAKNLPDARWEPSFSNSEAARRVQAGEVDAALAGAFAAPRYGLSVLADEVQDVDGAQTRFVLVTRPGPPPPPTGSDRTTVVLFERDDHPGALLEMLTEFAVRGVNLTRLESRPTGAGLGRYSFSVDCEGHVTEARVGEALSALHRLCAEVRFLGSYPRADGRAGVVRPSTSDDAFRDAAVWLSGLRGQAHALVAGGSATCREGQPGNP
ncbi:prephenate dehydratase [Protofrankia symbiont of Coriaria ruscifolia]|uniref:Prephenate dehydratase n=1 Tax=Candidatus Protofrankia californiensis TaxID=1839754 RepID=A0A1C3NT79_9ACTN|nr:prephenate dehydratase [Protofrankia symbiont of Coriaria ruscifolia]SBW17543.1 Prephenate dehydratase [Candidatus Protofrankia californiensis]